MKRELCEQCGEKQPPEWKAGDLCVACGGSVRREIRCAWCTGWTPAASYCRSCGCEIIGETEYGAARMLKEAGVDRFSMAERIRGLDADRLRDLERAYEAQLALAMRHVEQAEFCETYLLQRGYASRVEDELVASLPMSKSAFAELESGPRPPCKDRPELLPEIAAGSPIRLVRALASIALLRCGRIDRGVLAQVQVALQGEDSQLATEAACGLGHWRVRAHHGMLWKHENSQRPHGISMGAGIDRKLLAERARSVPGTSPLAPWAAAAVALAYFDRFGALPDPARMRSADEADDPNAPLWDELRGHLRNGLDRSCPDLRFTCALSLGECDIIAQALDSRDESQRWLARRFLAKHNSPAVIGCLREGSEEQRLEILDDLSTPLPASLVEPVLQVAEQHGPNVRRAALALLRATLSAETVHRLLRVAEHEGDREVFNTLLGAETLPESAAVVHAAIGAGLLRELRGELWRHIDYADPTVTRVVASGDAETVASLLDIAGELLSRAPAPEDSQPERPRGTPPPHVRAERAGRFLAQVAFGSHPAPIREQAYGVLEQYDHRLGRWMSRGRLESFFAGPVVFLRAAARLVLDADMRSVAHRLLEKLQDQLEVLRPRAQDERAALQELAHSLVDMARRNVGNDPVLQSSGCELLVKLTSIDPECTRGTIAGLLGDPDALQRAPGISRSLAESYTVWGPNVARGEVPTLLDALIGSIEAISTFHYSALDFLSEILARVLEDHPGTERAVAERLVRMENSLALPPRLRERLEWAASIVSREGGGAGASVTPDSAASTAEPFAGLEALDHEVLLPGEALPTLAEYVTLLRGMAAASNPVDLMAQHGLTVEKYLRCMEAWGQLIGSRDDVAIRYGQLLAEGPGKNSAG
ncbi:MAG: hypothetical protein AB1486_17920 [Planctomycetota bacterium]